MSPGPHKKGRNWVPVTHRISLGPGENIHELDADVWPGDRVELSIPNGPVLFLRKTPGGNYEFR